MMQLDSTSAREVMSSIRTLAQRENLIVIATIHQPNWGTLSQFDNILLLSEGQTCYEGKVNDLGGFLERSGLSLPQWVSRQAAKLLASHLVVVDEGQQSAGYPDRRRHGRLEHGLPSVHTQRHPTRTQASNHLRRNAPGVLRVRNGSPHAMRHSQPPFQ